MGHVFRLMGWLSLVLISACACGGDRSDPSVSIGDCQRAGEACGAGLVCQADAAGVLVCLPASDGGVDGDGGQRRPCDGQSEGHVLVEGDYSACTFVDDCSETGEQTRMNSVCRGGATVEEPQTQACHRDTDGTVVSQSDFGPCTVADACIETGEQTRTNSVCRDGVAVDEVEAAACVRDTDGTIVSQPEFGACGGFDNLCDRTGEQTRTNSVCRDGVASDEGETQVCERDDPGVRRRQPCGGVYDGSGRAARTARSNWSSPLTPWLSPPNCSWNGSKMRPWRSRAWRFSVPFSIPGPSTVCRAARDHLSPL